MMRVYLFHLAFDQITSLPPLALSLDCCSLVADFVFIFQIFNGFLDLLVVGGAFLSLRENSLTILWAQCDIAIISCMSDAAAGGKGCSL